MVNKYLLITGRNDCSQYITEASCWQRALSKYYDYNGETDYISVVDFETIIQKKSSEDAVKLFSHLIGDYVYFFGIIQQPFVNELIDIDKRGE